jgi:hypothetical protein
MARLVAANQGGAAMVAQDEPRVSA